MVRPGKRRDLAGGATDKYFADPGTFAAFYRNHYPRLIGYFVRRVSHAEQARDLTAETFAAGFEVRLKFRGQNEAQAKAWIFAIGEIKLKQFYAKKSVQTAALKRLRFTWPPPDDEELRRVEEMADAQAATPALQEALEQLTPQELDVVLRHNVDGESFADIVGHDGHGTPEALKKRNARALGKLSSSRELRERHGRRDQ